MDSDARQDLRRRLTRLGRRRSAPPAAAATASGSERLLAFEGGALIETGLGPAYRVERQFPITFEHGLGQLSDVLAFDQAPELTAQVAGSAGLAEVPIGQLAFLDTETTGLAGGAGTLIFLVGVGRFVDDRFVLRQYFLRDPAEEEGMLEALRQDLEAAAGFVTFNGRSFDLPLLENRYVIGMRRRWGLTSWPHLDLLPPARRLWRRQLPNCALSTIEQHVLGIARAEADVPGAEIPGMYLDYLRTGDASPLARVVYHNEIDVLSLVGLAHEVLARHQPPQPNRLTASEALGVARWHDRAGRSQRALAAYRAAVGGQPAGEVQSEALRLLSLKLKRGAQFDEAVETWTAWHQADPHDPRPCVELAKYYEWRAQDLEQAAAWAKEALVSLSRWEQGWRRRQRWAEVEHRLVRLQRKRGLDAAGA